MTPIHAHLVRLLALSASALMMVWSCQAHAQADEDTPSKLSLSGFGTLGAVNSHTNFEGKFARDVAQTPGLTGLQFKPDSRLGAQVNWAISESLEWVTQVVARDRPQNRKTLDSVELAFLGFRPNADTNIRIGRFHTDLYLLSEYRNVGFGYLTVRPNVDFYGAMSLNNSDGVDISHRLRTEQADWVFKAGIGNTRYDLNGTRNTLRNSTLLAVSREAAGLTLRGTLARGTLDYKFAGLDELVSGLNRLTTVPIGSVAQQAANLSAGMNVQGMRFHYAALGVAYEKDNWLVNAEWMKIQTPNKTMSGSGAYVVVGRRIGDFTPYIGLSKSRSSAPVYPTPNWGTELMPLAPVLGLNTVAQAQILGQMTTHSLNATRADQHTQTIGLRWDVNPKTSLKFQWDVVTVRPHGGLLWSSGSLGGKAHVGTVALDFVF